MALEDPALTRHIAHVFPSLDALFSAGEHAVALRASPGWQHVKELLQAEIDATYARIEHPKVFEQAEYAAAHGRVGGLKAAQHAVDAIVEVAERRRREQEGQHEAAGAEPPAAGR